MNPDPFNNGTNQFSNGASMGSFSTPGNDDWYGGGNSVNNEAAQYGNVNGAMSGPMSGGFGGPMGGAKSGGFTSFGFDKPQDNTMSGGIGGGNGGYDDDYVEPPLLVELGINFGHIYTKTISVIIPTKTIKQDILHDADLAGPIVFALVQGVCLMFSGKLHYGYIFGFGFVGCFSIYVILNLMSQTTSIDSWRTVSVLGYSILPIVVLSAFTILVSLRGPVGLMLTFIAILWCTQTATRFFEAALGMRLQRYLIAYPVFLFYCIFG
eukprot:CAMPEP_0184022110 /NCGR_PEP_ID=MMETSP0954-20121128/10386_1 /TAXON_ID=627963 /ORGANISM="Aplanochytrium sp, Strain PBS07" /LENGTH=265 /DNA_ID=CAMNT_0026304373 /DNA_START=174 /DNA_END=968 /DNA_ORIENTATION=-